MTCAASPSRCWASSAFVLVSSRSISAPPVATRRSCWLVRSDLPARFTVRAGRAIPTSRRHPRRARGQQPPNPRRRDPGSAAGAPRPSPVALADRDAGSARPASRPRRLSRSPGPSRIPFRRTRAEKRRSRDVDVQLSRPRTSGRGSCGDERAVFRALKPGGLYVIADHAGRPGTGISESGTLHRIEEAFLRQEVEAAGFRLSGGRERSLRNPNDPRDKNTPDPPQPKDEFVLKFVRP